MMVIAVFKELDFEVNLQKAAPKIAINDLDRVVLNRLNLIQTLKCA